MQGKKCANRLKKEASPENISHPAIPVPAAGGNSEAPENISEPALETPGDRHRLVEMSKDL
jgi:hypothetical protein